MIGHILGILIALAALYLAGAFVSAKLLNRDQWPFRASGLKL
jgi:succinate-acetate transporter protein